MITQIIRIRENLRIEVNHRKFIQQRSGPIRESLGTFKRKIERLNSHLNGHATGIPLLLGKMLRSDWLFEPFSLDSAQDTILGYERNLFFMYNFILPWYQHQLKLLQ